MRGVIYVLILASLLFVPLDRVRISQMLPIEAVAVREEAGMIVVETDCEVMGTGNSVAAAVEDLKRNAPAIVYLDTAKYLLISDDALGHIGEVREYLKPSVKVCISEEYRNIADYVRYLDVHAELPELKEIRHEELIEKR